LPRLTIRPQHHAGISTLLGWDPAVFDQFLLTLEQQPPSVSFFLPTFSDITFPNIPEQDGESVFAATVSLHMVRATADVALDAFVQDASDAIAHFDSAGSSQQSKERLRKLLGLESLAISAKAVTLLTDHQRTLHSLRILTDVRYVFQPDAEKEPQGAVISHMLKLSYHEGGDHKEFFVSLDGDDIANLRDALDRVDIKTATLKRKLALADVPYLGGADRSRGEK
jgi:hypothetical protein